GRSPGSRRTRNPHCRKTQTAVGTPPRALLGRVDAEQVRPSDRRPVRPPNASLHHLAPRTAASNAQCAHANRSTTLSIRFRKELCGYSYAQHQPVAWVNKARDVVRKMKSTALQYVRTHTSRSAKTDGSDGYPGAGDAGLRRAQACQLVMVMTAHATNVSSGCSIAR